VTTATDTERLASGTEITEANRAAWLAERRHSLGASEVAAVLGADPHRTPLDVWMAKVHPGEAEGPTFAQWWGLEMEGPLARAYERLTDEQIVQRQLFLRHERTDAFTATLDATSSTKVVEFKTVNARNREIIDQLGEPGSDEVPVPWMWQLTWQMFVAGESRADLLVAVGGGEPTLYTVHRNDTLVDHVDARARAFWRLVESQTPPPPTSPEDCRHLATLYRVCRGEVELGEGPRHAADGYRDAGVTICLAQKDRDRHRLELLAALGPADVGRLPDGRVVRRSVVEVKAHEVRASTQVRLSIKGG
jgi:putative phage-type endonuclease